MKTIQLFYIIAFIPAAVATTTINNYNKNNKPQTVTSTKSEIKTKKIKKVQKNSNIKKQQKNQQPNKSLLQENKEEEDKKPMTNEELETFITENHGTNMSPEAKKKIIELYRTKEAESAEAKRKLAETQIELAKMQAELAEFKRKSTDNKAMTEKYNELMEKYNKTNQELTGERGKSLGLQTQNEQSKKILKQYQDQNKTLELQLREAEKKLYSLRKNIEHLQKGLDISKNAILEAQRLIYALAGGKHSQSR